MNVSSLRETIQTIEPHLEASMRFLSPTHNIPPAGLRLRGGICAFASSVLRDALEQRGHHMDIRIGIPADRPGRLPGHMRQHVLLRNEDATVDPTWTQWLALVGVDPSKAAQNTEMASLYPGNRVAYIPAGAERQFGEQFADYALDVVPKVADIRRRVMGAVAGRKTRLDVAVCARLPEAAAYELLADIWNPDRYLQPFYPGDDAFGVRLAAVGYVGRSTVQTTF